MYLSDPPEAWLEAERLTLRMIREAKFLAERNGVECLVMVIGSVATVEPRWEEALAGYPQARHLQGTTRNPTRRSERLDRRSALR